MKTAFASLPIGTRFEFNSNVWVKKSTRTAYLEEFNRVFYFADKDLVRIMGLKG